MHFGYVDAVDAFPNTWGTKCAQAAGATTRLRHQHSRTRGGRMLLPEGQRRLPTETIVRSGRQAARYAIDPSSLLQGLQISTPAKSLDLQILQRTLEVLSHNLSCPVRLFRKSLMFVTSSHSVAMRHYPCIALVV